MWQRRIRRERRHTCGQVQIFSARYDVEYSDGASRVDARRKVRVPRAPSGGPECPRDGPRGVGFRGRRLRRQRSRRTRQETRTVARTVGLEKPVDAHVFRAVAPPNYTLSPDRKTVSMNAKSGAGQAFLSEQPITATSNSFTVLLNSLGTGINGLIVGVAKRGTYLRCGLHSKVGAYVVYLPKRSAHTFFKDGIRINGENRIVARSGSRLAVRFNPTCSRLLFELDNAELLPKLEITESNASQLFPVVDLYDAEQSVSFG